MTLFGLRGVAFAQTAVACRPVFLSVSSVMLAATLWTPLRRGGGVLNRALAIAATLAGFVLSLRMFGGLCYVQTRSMRTRSSRQFMVASESRVCPDDLKRLRESVPARVAWCHTGGFWRHTSGLLLSKSGGSTPRVNAPARAVRFVLRSE